MTGLLETYFAGEDVMAPMEPRGLLDEIARRPSPVTEQRLNDALFYLLPLMGTIRTMPAPSWNAKIKSYDLGVNPTRKEMMQLFRDDDTLRVLTSGDDLYAWPANAALHSDVGAALGLSPKSTRHGLIGREQVR